MSCSGVARNDHNIDEPGLRVAFQAQLLEAFCGLIDAVVDEVNEKGAGGYLLARLSDARTAVAEAKGRGE